MISKEPTTLQCGGKIKKIKIARAPLRRPSKGIPYLQRSAHLLRGYLPQSERRYQLLSLALGYMMQAIEARCTRKLTTTPLSYIHPTIVVPVLVAFGRGTPLAWSAALRLKFEKSKPGMAGSGG
jgi:hypothetical protein